jgi:hypothetical protein
MTVTIRRSDIDYQQHLAELEPRNPHRQAIARALVRLVASGKIAVQEN